MKRILCLFLALFLCVGVIGCTAEQKKSFDDNVKVLMAYVDEKGKDADAKIDEFVDATTEALATVTELITAAEKDEAPVVPGEPSPVVEGAGSILKAIAPALPPIAREIALALGMLLPFGVAWFRAKTEAGKRTAEEALLIAGLQQLKKKDRDAFDKFVEYRDKAAEGVLTIAETKKLLAGISEIRAKYS